MKLSLLRKPEASFHVCLDYQRGLQFWQGILEQQPKKYAPDNWKQNLFQQEQDYIRCSKMFSRNRMKYVHENVIYIYFYVITSQALTHEDVRSHVPKGIFYTQPRNEHMDLLGLQGHRIIRVHLVQTCQRRLEAQKWLFQLKTNVLTGRKMGVVLIC